MKIEVAKGVFKMAEFRSSESDVITPRTKEIPSPLGKWFSKK